MTYATFPVSGGGGSGDVQGPASSVNNGVVIFDGTSGKIIKDAGVGSANQVLVSDGTTPSFAQIVNANISAGAAIDLNKLATVTADRALVSNGSGVIAASSVTATELGYLSGVTSGIQAQIDGKLSLTGGTLTGNLTVSASNAQVQILSSTATAQLRLDSSTRIWILQNTSNNLVFRDGTGAANRAQLDTFGSLSIFATSNQLVLGSTNTTTISATAPSASRVYTMPDVGGNADFVMTAGAQTIAGVKTFSSTIVGDISGNAGTVTNGAYVNVSNTFTQSQIFSSGILINAANLTGIAPNADDLLVGNQAQATERGITIGSTTAGAIRWNDGADAGIIEYVHSSNYMRFIVAGSTEPMRLVSSGQVLLNATSGNGQLTIQDDGSTRLLDIVCDDSSPFGIFIRNTTFSASANEGLDFYVSNAGIAYLESRGTGSQLACTVAGAEAFRVNSSQAFGIGTSTIITPAKLQITNSGDTNIYLSDSSQASGSRFWGINNTSTRLDFRATTDAGTGGNTPLSLSRSGAVIIGPTGGASVVHSFYSNRTGSTTGQGTIQINVTASASGQRFMEFYHTTTTQVGGIERSGTSTTPQFFSGTSDRRLKTNIDLYKGNALAGIRAVPLYSYNMKDEPDAQKIKGPMAQDIQKYFPHKVRDRGDGYLQLSMGWEWEFWEAFQELAAEVERLKAA